MYDATGRDAVVHRMGRDGLAGNEVGVGGDE